MKNNIFVLLIVALFIGVACEDTVNPIEGTPTTELFVQLGANTPDSAFIGQGDSLVLTIQAPQSVEKDLVASLTFGGDAQEGIDYIVSVGPDDNIVSVSPTGLEVIVPFIPAGGVDVIADQVNVVFKPAVAGSNTFLNIELDGAVSVDGANTFAGGRGPIRKETVIQFL